jgi:hypothetical protein
MKSCTSETMPDSRSGLDGDDARQLTRTESWHAEQVFALRRTIASATRSNDAAGVQAEAQVTEPLADNARLPAELDSRAPRCTARKLVLLGS